MKGATVMIWIWMTLLMIIILLFLWTWLKSKLDKQYQDLNIQRSSKNGYSGTTNDNCFAVSVAFQRFPPFTGQFTSHLETSKKIHQHY